MLKAERTAIGEALGRLPSGCSILTVAYEGQSTGVLVSWVQQASFEPPMVSFCLKRGRYVAELLDAAGVFLLNQIGEEPAALFRQFGRGFGRGDNAFQGLEIEPTSFGPLIPGCVGYLGGRVVQRIETGDHDLYVGEVIAGHGETGNPHVHLRKSGFSY